MSSPIDKKTLEHLAKLTRIELDPKEEAKLLADLKKILAHFEELEGLDTSNVEPSTGGTRITNVFRADDARDNTNRGAGAASFPEREKGFLKVPPVFSAKGGSAPGGE